MLSLRPKNTSPAHRLMQMIEESSNCVVLDDEYAECVIVLQSILSARGLVIRRADHVAVKAALQLFRQSNISQKQIASPLEWIKSADWDLFFWIVHQRRPGPDVDWA